MKHLTHFILILFLGFSGFLHAETEPNDTWNQANPVLLSSVGSGVTGFSNEQDWWEVSIPDDGKLTVNWTSVSGIPLWCRIYDTLGVQLFVQNYTSSTTSINIDGIAAGYYYIQFNSYYASESGAYTFTPIFTPASVPNDPENNDVYTQASIISLNDTVTGHIGYYHNSYDDLTDWWKLTTTLDGKINFSITSLNGSNVYAELFDGNGTTFLAGSYTTTTGNYSRDGLMPGVYYIRVHTYYQSEFAPYILRNNLALPPNFAEPGPANDSAQIALQINLNDSVNGHIGYYYNGTDDLRDWYKFSTTEDGRVDFRIYTLNGQNIYAELFDGDAMTYLAGNYTTTTALYSKDGLGSGEYYIRIRNYYDSEFSPYALIITHTPTVPDDPENNNTPASAVVINSNDSVTGHIGYSYNGYDDIYDWYSVTTSEDGKLNWKITSLNGQHVYAELFDNDGTTFLAGNYTNTQLLSFKDGLAAGTYFIRIKTYYANEFVPYILITSHDPAALLNDPEPNNQVSSAIVFNVNSTVTGHSGYYYNHYDDTLDYYSLTLPVDGKLSISVTSSNGQHVYARLYDHNGTTVIFQNYTNSTLTQVANNLAAGTYYVAVNTYYHNEFVPYTLTNTLEPMNYAAEDTSYNSFAASATLLPSNTPSTGHLNFYYDLQYDSKDWWVIGYDGNGAMQLHIDLEQNHFNTDYPYINWSLFSDTASSQIAGGQVHAPVNTFNLSGLAVGKYYLRLQPAFSSFGAYSLLAEYTERCLTIADTANVMQLPGCTGSITYNLSNGLPPYSVQLFKDGSPFGSQLSGSSSVTFSSLGYGTYYAKAYSFGGSGLCNNQSASVSFTEPDVTITPGGTTIFCEGGTVTLTSTPASSYYWSTGETTQSINVMASGNYTVSITDINGCTNISDAVPVIVNPLPSKPIITGSPLAICDGESVILSSTSAVSYLWSTNQSTQSISVADAGSYTVTVTDMNGCTNISDPVTVTVNSPSSWYADLDNDGYGDASEVLMSCNQPSGYVPDNTDCDDNADSIHPGATELCNSADDDCDGLTDEGCGTFTYYPDADNDSYGDPGNPFVTSDPVIPSGYVTDNTDCNDNNNAVNPSASEACNLTDDDCDGQIDEGVQNTYYADSDADGYGSSFEITACTQPSGTSANNADCNDADGTVNPAAAEVCNGTDDNCDGQTDEGVLNIYYTDADGDGYGSGSEIYACIQPSGTSLNNTDCNDASSAIHPFAVELCNSIDDNCDLQIDEGCGGCLNPPVAEAGMDVQVCSGDMVPVYGSISGGAASAVWTTSGSGSFLPDPFMLNSTYDPSPSDESAGSVTLYLTTDAPSGCNAAIDSIIISFTQLPVSPGIISGATMICQPGNSQFVYSVVPVSGVTGYAWSVPIGGMIVSGQGTPSITVKYVTSFVHAGIQGDVCVSTYNGGTCGNSMPSCLSVSVQGAAPVTPPSISGAAKACPGDVEIYSIAPVHRAVSYNWNLPAGATIISGAGTNIVHIEFNAGFTGTGVLGVTAQNACGTSPARTRTILRNILPAPSVIAGQSSGVCGGESLGYDIQPLVSATSYSWTLPGGATTSGNLDGSEIYIDYPLNFNSGNLTVAAINGCGTGSTRSLTIKGAPGIPGTITGSISVCTGSIQPYSIASVQGADTYTWTAPGTVINQGSKNIDVQFTNAASTNQIITVKAVNACGSSAVKILNQITIQHCARTADEVITFNVYPNPSNGKISLQVYSKVNTDCKLEIVDAKGSIVSSDDIEIMEGDNSMNVDLSQFQSGIYLIRITGNDFIQQQRIIIE